MSEWKQCRAKPTLRKFREVKHNVEEIHTREGVLYAYKDEDFVIMGVEGEVYPIKKDIFAKTYEVIE